MAVLGLRFCATAFSSRGKRGPLFIAVRRPLTIAASLVVEHRLQTRRLSSCGSWAQLLRGMWDLPRPGLEPVSPALAGGFSTTVPPGKPCICFFIQQVLISHQFYTHQCIHVNPNRPVHHTTTPNPCRFPCLVCIRLFSTSVSQFLPCKLVHLYHFSRFHIYALIYNISFSLSDLLHSV